MTSAVEAMQAIAAAEAPFVSRGDDSGTHALELGLWEQAGIEPGRIVVPGVGHGHGRHAQHRQRARRLHPHRGTYSHCGIGWRSGSSWRAIRPAENRRHHAAHPSASTALGVVLDLPDPVTQAAGGFAQGGGGRREPPCSKFCHKRDAIALGASCARGRPVLGPYQGPRGRPIPAAVHDLVQEVAEALFATQGPRPVQRFFW